MEVMAGSKRSSLDGDGSAVEGSLTGWAVCRKIFSMLKEPTSEQQMREQRPRLLAMEFMIVVTFLQAGCCTN